jgi:hypothetical protein
MGERAEGGDLKAEKGTAGEKQKVESRKQKWD